jgi:hypothetical protein
MANTSSKCIAVGGAAVAEQHRLLLFLLFILKFYRHDANPLPSSIPPPLNPHNRWVDDCVAGEEEVLIEGWRWRWRQRRWRRTSEGWVKKII